MIVPCLIPFIGYAFAFFVAIAVFYFLINKTSKTPHHILLTYELNLKKLISQYGDEMITIYKLTAQTSIKHIGE